VCVCNKCYLQVLFDVAYLLLPFMRLETGGCQKTIGAFAWFIVQLFAAKMLFMLFLMSIVVYRDRNSASNWGVCWSILRHLLTEAPFLVLWTVCVRRSLCKL